ncbi:hypothetical protein A3K73_08885 [Candidatus Pacearchaeota archaeon RBG_13_36_9]|nr:MAG: hypothetical protein A3K73_08885 [Candidatus Pacearchaeota archaeon RBG_13_36_9]HJX50359.1 winged helix-turn-helix transcriptional regulator [Candidatus Nanoarchaeia archaeon]
MKIDKKGMQILGILDWDARIPISGIAKKTRLNKDVVRYRISNLERDNVLEGYYTIVNTSKLGYLTFRIYFDFINLNKQIEAKIINYLDNKFNAGQIFSIDGEYQLGVICWEKSVYELHKKLVNFKKIFGNFINKEEMAIFVSLDHYPKKFLNNTQKEVISLKEEEKIKIKDEDVEILKELSKNARISSVDLSVKLKIPQTTIIYKIKQLRKDGIILGYRAKINTEKLGYQNYYLSLYTNNTKEVTEIMDYAKYNLNCIYSGQVIPEANIEIETEFQSKPELLELIDKLKERFKSIKKIKYWSTLKYYKLNYYPF